MVLAAVAFILVRHFLYPETFGMYGHFRYASVAEFASIAPRHGAPEACDACHDEQAEARAAGKHSSVSCEVCHGPLAGHVEGDAWAATMPVQRSNDLCAWCHERLTARPKQFPQIVTSAHVTEKGAEMTEEVCLECHDAHNPSE